MKTFLPKCFWFGWVLLILSGGCAKVETRERTYRNLFSEYLGKSEAEIDAKLDQAWNHFFYGSDESQRIYYPVGEDMAYIYDVGSDDARSEGMSYGMMIAVQLDKQKEFNRIWKWTKTYMYHNSGPREGFFAWHCARDGTQLSEGSASDGEEWFAMALFFAERRWGNGEGIFNYGSEANAVLQTMLREREEPDGEIFSMWDREAKIIRFVPEKKWAHVTDPSYHLPAFYELWARWADEDNDFWAEAAEVSRAFFKQAAHPNTGLMADYTYLDGRPFTHRGHEDFRFDSWRNFSNVALDYAWWGKDSWAVEQSNRVLSFLRQFEDFIPNQMKIDGTPLSDSGSSGLSYMAATAGLASNRELSEPFVEYLWDASFGEGKWRYYDGMLHMLALLQVSGRYQIWEP
jgi:oligosaccharide reducing-end xylanase